jgi:hypothetical protein
MLQAGTCHKRPWIRVAMNRDAKLGFYFGYDLSTLKKLHERRAPAVRKRIYPVLPVVLDEIPGWPWTASRARGLSNVIDTGCCAKQDHLILRVELRRSLCHRTTPGRRARYAAGGGGGGLGGLGAGGFGGFGGGIGQPQVIRSPARCGANDSTVRSCAPHRAVLHEQLKKKAPARADRVRVHSG